MGNYSKTNEWLVYEYKLKWCPIGQAAIGICTIKLQSITLWHHTKVIRIYYSIFALKPFQYDFALLLLNHDLN